MDIQQCYCDICNFLDPFLHIIHILFILIIIPKGGLDETPMFSFILSGEVEFFNWLILSNNQKFALNYTRLYYILEG